MEQALPTSGLAALVERAAEHRGDDPVPRDFVVEALDLVESGVAECPRYSTGVPSLRHVHAIAARIFREAKE